MAKAIAGMWETYLSVKVETVGNMEQYSKQAKQSANAASRSIQASTMRILDFIKFRYCPRCGEQHLQPNDAKSFVCTACKFVYYHSSAATVAAMIQYEDKIILTQRANEPQKGTLALPGGFVDYEENLEDALVRELREELNINVSTPVYLCSYGEQFQGGEVTYFCIVAFYVVQVTDITGITARDDIDAFLLIGPSEIDYSKLGFESDRAALDIYRRSYPDPICIK